MLALAAGSLAAIGVQVAADRELISDRVASSLPGQFIWFAVGMALAVASVASARAVTEPSVVRFVSVRPGLCWAAAALAFAALIVVVDPDGLAGIVQTVVAEQPVPKTLASIALSASMICLILLPAVFGERAGGLPRRLLASPLLVCSA